MGELVAGRIVRHAERLKLSHLTDTAEQLCQRAEDAQLGYREFLDWSWTKRSPCASHGGSPTR
jgi:hypothetical protein